VAVFSDIRASGGVGASVQTRAKGFEQKHAKIAKGIRGGIHFSFPSVETERLVRLGAQAVTTMLIRCSACSAQWFGCWFRMDASFQDQKSAYIYWRPAKSNTADISALDCAKYYL